MTRPKELIAKWPLNKDFNFEGCFSIFFNHRDAARSWNPRVSCLSVVVLVEVKMVLDMAHLSCLVVLMQLGMLLYNNNNN